MENHRRGYYQHLGRLMLKRLAQMLQPTGLSNKTEEEQKTKNHSDLSFIGWRLSNCLILPSIPVSKSILVTFQHVLCNSSSLRNAASCEKLLNIMVKKSTELEVVHVTFQAKSCQWLPIGLSSLCGRWAHETFHLFSLSLSLSQWILFINFFFLPVFCPHVMCSGVPWSDRDAPMHMSPLLTVTAF